VIQVAPVETVAVAAVIDQVEYLHPSICHEDISVSDYFEWEEAVVEQVATALDVGHSNASAIVEAQLFRLQQAWSMGMDAEQAARIVVESSAA
jgi:hypothetical protein